MPFKGGDVQIINKKLEWNVKAKIGSLGKLDKEYKEELNCTFTIFLFKNF